MSVERIEKGTALTLLAFSLPIPALCHASYARLA